MHAMLLKRWPSDDALAYAEVPTPPVRAGEVRVRVAYSSVNPVDWKIRKGEFIGNVARLFGLRAPYIPGIDFAGVVEEVGGSISRTGALAVGDRVVGGVNPARQQRGASAEYVVVRPDQCAKLPDTVALDAAATLPVAGVTAVISLFEFGRLPSDGRVLVLGAAGGVGSFAVPLAKDHGAHVTAVCSSRNAETLTARGADAIIDYTQPDIDPLDAAREHGPFDVIIEAVGVYSPRRCRRLLSKRGRLALVAPSTAGAICALLHPFKSRMVLGRPTTKRLQRLVDAVARGAMDPWITDRVPLRDLEDAHARSMAGKLKGKVVVEVGGEIAST